MAGVADLAERIAALPVAEHTAWVFPGQDAQFVGMGRDLVERSPAAREVFDVADAALGISISRLCFEGPEAELARTINTQPAIMTHSIAALMAALDEGTITHRPAFVAGHSLGEYAALVTSGAVTFEDGVRLVRERGRLMQEACDREPGTMAAILGMAPDALRDICSRLGAAICNINAPGNITIGGSTAAVAAASAAATVAGAVRVIPLAVSGAFHTPLMRSAAEGMQDVLASVAFRAPMIPVISNVTAQPIVSADGLPQELTAQITHPVLWVDSVEAMRDSGMTEVVEFGPTRVLTGLIRRIDRAIGLKNIGHAESSK